MYKYIDEFKQFDEKRIVIDATNPTRRGAPIFFLLIVIILPLLGIYSFQGGNNNFAENYTIILINCVLILSGIFKFLSPEGQLSLTEKRRQSLFLAVG